LLNVIGESITFNFVEEVVFGEILEMTFKESNAYVFLKEWFQLNWTAAEIHLYIPGLLVMSYV